MSVYLHLCPLQLICSNRILCQCDNSFSHTSHSKLATREYLDKYLASAFNLPLENGKLKAIDEHQYVLTLDYTLKVCLLYKTSIWS